MTEHKFVTASRYIESLRSAAKKRYARHYYQYIRAGRREPSPEYPALSYMAAQAVRMQLDEIMEGRP